MNIRKHALTCTRAWQRGPDRLLRGRLCREFGACACTIRCHFSTETAG
jgi:hypothetical protein